MKATTPCDTEHKFKWPKLPKIKIPFLLIVLGFVILAAMVGISISTFSTKVKDIHFVDPTLPYYSIDVI